MVSLQILSKPILQATFWYEHRPNPPFFVDFEWLMGVSYHHFCIPSGEVLAPGSSPREEPWGAHPWQMESRGRRNSKVAGIFPNEMEENEGLNEKIIELTGWFFRPTFDYRRVLVMNGNQR